MNTLLAVAVFSILARDLNNIAARSYQERAYEHAATYYRRSIEAWRAAGGGPDLGVTLCNLAVLHRTTGRYAAAVTEAQEGLKYLSDSRATTCWTTIAEALRNLGDLGGAETAALKGVEVSDGGRRGWALQALGNVYQVSGQTEKAAAAYRQALDLRRGTPEAPATLVGLASLELRQKRLDAAAQLAGEALQVVERLYGAEHPELIAPLNLIAQVRCLQERFAEAEPLFRRSLELSERFLGLTHPDTARIHRSFGDFMFQTGRYAAAEQIYRKAGAVLLAELGPDHPQTAEVHVALARTYLAMNRRAEGNKLMTVWLPVLSFSSTH